MTDLRQTKEYSIYLKLLGWKVENYETPHGDFQIFIKNIPFLGKVIKIQRPQFISKEIVDKIIVLHKPTALYVEPPLSPLLPLLPNFSQSKSCFLPPKTIQINLEKYEKELLVQMKPKTRYNIKIAQKRGVVVKESSDIETFCSLWKASARKRGMWLSQSKEIRSLYQAFGNKARLFLAHLPSPQNSLLAGVLVVSSPDIAFYMYAGSTQEGKKLFAPTLLAWEAIKIAKKDGYKFFDFEGIYDERYSQTKTWKGFTKFKEGFGGEVVTFPKTLVKYSNLFMRLLF